VNVLIGCIAEICARAIESAAERRVSAVNFVEAAVVTPARREEWPPALKCR
jgi:hypothetical protein